MLSYEIYKVVIFPCFLVTSTPSFAQSEPNKAFLYDIDLDWLAFNKNLPVSVTASDQVDDGCWTNAKQTENAVKLELQRSGFEIYDSESTKSLLFNQVILEAVGFKAGDSCAVSYRTILKVIETDTKSYEDGKFNLTSLYFKILWSNGGILTGGNSSERLKSSFVETIQELLLLRVQVIKNMFDEAINLSEEEDAKQYWESYKEQTVN